jgi:hypothetical protein
MQNIHVKCEQNNPNVQINTRIKYKIMILQATTKKSTHFDPILLVQNKLIMKFNISNLPPIIYTRVFLKMLDLIPAKQIQNKELSN